MAQVPHLALPFQFIGNTVATIEQDSPEEVHQNVLTIMRYVPGERPELPEFGVPDQSFRERVDTEEILSAITTFEPRAAGAVDVNFILDTFTARVSVTVGSQQ